MQIIIMTDIFGLTTDIDLLAVSLSTELTRVTVIDPYDGHKQTFINEQAAYDAFMTLCGHEQYISAVASAIALSEDEVVLLGFSAGASAAWKAIDRHSNPLIKHCIGFYPSQIRNHLDVIPCCPVTLVFPCEEKHFEVDNILSALASLKQVHCIKTSFYHGFMNSLSENYSLSAATFFTDKIRNKIKLDNIGILN
ncbi:dienelactone hydrolase family protein [Moritella sp. 36]|uniref:dienelactone hydrolase family protein n=1 Tax=Moritella sp. 36 TaxID=2746233 RepID=UPI001BA6DB52|nr:dienelactone hydrolase family protein [Moritella sp. 36]QUM90087.1 dienelactone hydrolase family protein [Moritella sp. 36]